MNILHPRRKTNGPFQVYVSKSSKLRKRECSRSSSATTLPAFEVIVVFVPIYPASRYGPSTRSSRSLSSETTSTLPKIIKLLGVNVKAYESRMSNMAVEVNHRVILDINEEPLFGALDASSPVVHVRRLGRTESVALTLTSATLPDDVKVASVRIRSTSTWKIPLSVRAAVALNMLLPPADHHLVFAARRNVIHRNVLQQSRKIRKLWQKTYLPFSFLSTV